MVRKDTTPLSFIGLVAASCLACLFASRYAGGGSFARIAFILSLAVLSVSSSVDTLRRLVRANRPVACRLHPPVAVALSIGAILGIAAHIRICHERSFFQSLASEERVTTLSCRVLSDPVRRGDSFACRVVLEAAGYPDGAWFTLRGYALALLPAPLVRRYSPDGLSLAGRSYRVYPGSEIVLNGSFVPYRSGGTRDGLRVFRVSSFGDGPVEGSLQRSGRPARSPLAWLARVRSSLRLGLTRLLYEWGSAGGLLLALLSGNREYIDPSVSLAFRNAGLSHVLALSGMHLSVIACSVGAVGRMLGGKAFARFVSVLSMVFFVWFAGNSPSLDRALTMTLTALFFSRIGIDRGLAPILAVGAIVQVARDPSMAFESSFMLSYGALWGIATTGAYLSEISAPYAPSWIREPLCAGVGAWSSTALVSAVTFGELAPIGILASCAVTPLATLYVLAGGLAILASAALPPASALCSSAIRPLYEALVSLVNVFSGAPHVKTRDLPACVLAGILSIAVVSLARVTLAFNRNWRSPDAGFARLRFTRRSQALPRVPRNGHAKEVRAEFPRKSERPPTARVRART